MTTAPATPDRPVISATSMRTDRCGDLGTDDVDRSVALCGWVARRREHGEHLAFVDLRDRSGVVQCVVDGASDLRSEYVVRITGTVRHRPEGTTNPDLATGEIEVGNCQVEVLNASEPPPFPISDRVDADETMRLRHRYVDLRRARMQRNLAVRAAVTRALRSAMDRQGFLEVETPLLWVPTPEGAREFVIPSRLQTGSFYVLPQSPQLAKQLLMVAGLDRYYQIARCLRDEDLRADRQFEFAQLDLEASFVSQDDVLAFVTEAVLDATEAATGKRPEQIERLTWLEAMERFGSDKPDLRAGPELVELTELFAGTGFRAFAGADCIKGMRVPGHGDLGRNRLDALTDRAKVLGAKGLVWLRVGEGGALDSPVAKFLSDGEQTGLVDAVAAVAGDLVLMVADERPVARTVLGQLRLDLGRPPVGEGDRRFLWITEFPLFEGLDTAGRPVPAHHAFTMPHPDDLELLESDPLAVRSQSYDLVLNGWELGSGSIRIHRGDIQSRIFSLLGISEADAQARFGFLLGAFRYGAPPHGGFAVGLDRLVAILAGEENIREVIAFPKTQSGADPLTGAPAPVASQVLTDLGIRLLPPPAP
ncbi:MAG TPA: aspartate--tRNA ligase [Acidimicrobiales bacterium]|nr:aspartate--tRNA ligase [Acidimicrobiales bacterium]